MSLLLTSFAIAAAAPTAPPPPTKPAPDVVAKASHVDQEALAAAFRLLDSQGFEQDALSSVEMFTDAILASVIKRRQEQMPDEELPTGFVDEMRATIRNHAVFVMKREMPELKRKTAEIYAAQLTAVELDRITLLSADPAMKKLRDRLKVMQPQLVMLGIQTMSASEPELDAKIRALVEKYSADPSADSEHS